MNSCNPVTRVFLHSSCNTVVKGDVEMRTSLNLLNELTGLGFDQQKALTRIDKILDMKLGIDERKPLLDEVLPDVVYNDILGIFLRTGAHGTPCNNTKARKG